MALSNLKRKMKKNLKMKRKVIQTTSRSLSLALCVNSFLSFVAALLSTCCGNIILWRKNTSVRGANLKMPDFCLLEPMILLFHKHDTSLSKSINSRKAHHHWLITTTTIIIVFIITSTLHSGFSCHDNFHCMKTHPLISQVSPAGLNLILRWLYVNFINLSFLIFLFPLNRRLGATLLFEVYPLSFQSVSPYPLDAVNCD